jgi:phosphoribosylpyrophosphate synthetase
MWFISGGHSSLRFSFVSCLAQTGESFSEIRTLSYPDGEIGFDLPPLDQSSSHVFIQLPIVDAGIFDADKTYISALSLSGELKREWNDLLVCIPYMPYSQNPNLLKAFTNLHAGLVTLDLHDSQYPGVRNLYPTNLFVEQIRNNPSFDENCFVFAPDKGASWRGEQIASALDVPLIAARKIRDRNGSCTIEAPVRTGLRTCIIVDDIVSSGETIKGAIRFARTLGVEHIIVIVTHTLGACPKDAQYSCITTNSFPNAVGSSADCNTIDVAPFLISKVTRLLRQSAEKRNFELSLRVDAAITDDALSSTPTHAAQPRP